MGVSGVPFDVVAQSPAEKGNQREMPCSAIATQAIMRNTMCTLEVIASSRPGMVSRSDFG